MGTFVTILPIANQVQFIFSKRLVNDHRYPGILQWNNVFRWFGLGKTSVDPTDVLIDDRDLCQSE
jgi:hypothetical protein